MKVLLCLGDHFPRMAQVHYDKVEASQSSSYCTRFVIDLDKSSRRKPTCFCGCRVPKGLEEVIVPSRSCKACSFVATRRGLPVYCSSHNPAPCCKHPTTVAAPIRPFMSKGRMNSQPWLLLFFPLGFLRVTAEAFSGFILCLLLASCVSVLKPSQALSFASPWLLVCQC